MAKGLVITRYTMNKGEYTKLMASCNNSKKVINSPRVNASTKKVIEKDAIGAAQDQLDRYNINYSGNLRNSFRVIKTKTRGSQAFRLTNVAPYADQIDSGNNTSNEWISSLEELNKWRRQKLGFETLSPIVKVGKSGGGERFKDIPFPTGVHFQAAAWDSVLKESDMLAEVMGQEVLNKF